MKRRTILALGAVFAAAIAHGTPLVEQQIKLTSGWNAVYLSIAPTNSADEVFADWPVESVSAYNADSFLYTESTAGGVTGESVVRASYWIWSRKADYASTLKSIAADTVLLCRSTNTTAFTTTLVGTPAAPRIAWHESNKDNREMLNPIGLRVGGSGTIDAAEWFAGSPLVEGSTVYRMSGTNDTPRFVKSASGYGANATETLSDGQVVFVAGSEVSDWSGPLYICPRSGVDFGSEGSLDEISIRNDGEEEKTVTITYTNSLGSDSRPDLQYFDGGTGDDTGSGSWTPFTTALTRTVATGETWRVSLALDRTKLSGSGAALDGILEIAEDGGTLSKSWLGVSAIDTKGANPWPTGLWVANIKLSKVCYYRKDGDRVDGVTAGGVMPVRALLVVDADGKAKLVQRAYVDDVRISSAFLPVDLGEVAGAGTFGSGDLAFKYTIGAESPSNPFRHALHPFFDGKQMDFKTAAPNGDDFQNYVGSVKPEWFSIGGEIGFTFDDNNGASWNPQEMLTGTAKWIYRNVRRDGDVVAEGRFTMQRVAKEATL